MCLYPKLINNRRYVVTKKNGGVIPSIKDKRMLLVPVGCQKCIECRKKKSREWSTRLMEEIRHDNKGKFVTLTFSNESIKQIINGEDLKGKKISKPITKISGYNLDNEIATIAVRRFLERWRKKNKKSVKHWLVTELGQNKTERIHIHGIIFSNKIEDIVELWKYGIVTIGERRYINGKAVNDKSLGYVTERTINYIVKYVSKVDENHKEYMSKILTSPGIGKEYLNRTDSRINRYRGKETNELYHMRDGNKLALPIYYRNKIYTEEERMELWINKLDENKRYVLGQEICIKKGEEQYYKTLEYGREYNERMGYGDDKVNWERRKYENERRALKKIEMIKEKNNKINKQS